MHEAGTRKLFSLARWLISAASLAWVLYSLTTWLAPGLLCRAGDGEYCAEASNEALRKTPEDGEAAAFHATRGCQLGSATSCNNLGVCYERGAGVPKDRVKSLEYYGRACGLEAGLGCYNAANLIKDEDGRAKEATTYFDRACKLRWGPGCRAAVTRHPGEGRVALDRADAGCALEDAPSCAMSALMTAILDPRSAKARERLVQVTADCGRDEAGSCTTLGLLYAGGFGVEPDAARAHDLVTRACRHGADRACKMLEQPALMQETLELFKRLAGEAKELKIRP